MTKVSLVPAVGSWIHPPQIPRFPILKHSFFFFFESGTLGYSRDQPPVPTQYSCVEQETVGIWEGLISTMDRCKACDGLEVGMSWGHSEPGAKALAFFFQCDFFPFSTNCVRARLFGVTGRPLILVREGAPCENKGDRTKSPFCVPDTPVWGGGGGG